ncbi:MAG: Glyoxylate reductase [Firmicutes bacterium]|nr:Glyoxylate reductase [Bacillota bacterium]
MPSLNILVVQRLSDKQINMISETGMDINVTTCKKYEAINYIKDTDVLITWGQHDIRDLLPQATRLKWVHSLSAGVDKLLSPEFISSDITLTNSRGIHGIPMAEHVLAMMLTFTRSIHQTYENQKARAWQLLSLEELYDKSIAIIGLGSIGREIAKRAKCLGMKVLATKRTMTQEIFIDKLYPMDQLPHLLSSADFVVVTLPLTQHTKGLFSLETFRTMKKSAYFINVARGPIVNEADLITALETGVIKGAALDVFNQEPLPEDSPLWTVENLIITPHIAANSPYYIDRALKLFIENLSKFYNNAEMLNIINKQSGY